MPKVTIPAGRSVPIVTTSLYLSIIDATANFGVSFKKEPTPLAGRIGRQFVLDGTNQVEFVNTSDFDIVVEYESANTRVFGSGSGAVNIANQPTIQRIVEPIDFEATVTFDTGTVGQLVSTVLNTPAHITIPAGQAAQLIAGNARVGRKIELQVISAELTELYVGADNTIDATKGLMVRGSNNYTGGAVIETESGLWAFNNSSTAAKVAVMEIYRS